MGTVQKHAHLQGPKPSEFQLTCWHCIGDKSRRITHRCTKGASFADFSGLCLCLAKWAQVEVETGLALGPNRPADGLSKSNQEVVHFVPKVSAALMLKSNQKLWYVTVHNVVMTTSALAELEETPDDKIIVGLLGAIFTPPPQNKKKKRSERPNKWRAKKLHLFVG